MEKLDSTPKDNVIDYATPVPRRWKKPTAAEIFVLLGVLALLVAIVLPLWIRSNPVSGRLPCPSNLRVIGQAMFLWAHDHGGRYPTTIADLLSEGLDPKAFVCPDTSDTPAKAGPTTQATAANILAGGHLSYVILFPKSGDTPANDAVLAYEPPGNHQNVGINVLFGDFHVEFLDATAAPKLLAELKAGHNPPRQEAMK